VTPDEIAAWQVKRKLLELARDNCAKQFDDHSRTFTSLDSKAQAVATFAGAQLGVLLALLPKDALRLLLVAFGWKIWILILGTVTVLLVDIAAALVAMRVRKTPLPFLAEPEVEAMNDIVALPLSELSEEVAVNHLSEHLGAWSCCLRDMATVIQNKAQDVFVCQCGLLFGLVGTTATLVLALLALS
jgi:hypothetical protein